VLCDVTEELELMCTKSDVQMALSRLRGHSEAASPHQLARMLMMRFDTNQDASLDAGEVRWWCCDCSRGVHSRLDSARLG